MDYALKKNQSGEAQVFKQTVDSAVWIIDKETVLREVEAIEKVLTECSKGGENISVRNKIERHLASIGSASGFGYGVNGKLTSIRSWLKILFSSRKHERYGGIQTVQGHIYHDLTNIRGIASRESQT